MNEILTEKLEFWVNKISNKKKKIFFLFYFNICYIRTYDKNTNMFRNLGMLPQKFKLLSITIIKLIYSLMMVNSTTFHKELSIIHMRIMVFWLHRRYQHSSGSEVLVSERFYVWTHVAFFGLSARSFQWFSSKLASFA